MNDPPHNYQHVWHIISESDKMCYFLSFIIRCSACQFWTQNLHIFAGYLFRRAAILTSRSKWWGQCFRSGLTDGGLGYSRQKCCLHAINHGKWGAPSSLPPVQLRIMSKWEISYNSYKMKERAVSDSKELALSRVPYIHRNKHIKEGFWAIGTAVELSLPVGTAVELSLPDVLLEVACGKIEN